MIHCALPLPSRVFQPALLPLTPAAYLRLCRKRAGLSVADVARRIADAGEFVLPVLLIRELEHEGVKARHRSTIEALAKAVPLDVDVYLQLRDTSPNEHPRICRTCGCSEWDPCASADGTHACSWAGAVTCSRCAFTPAIPVHQ